LLKRATFFLAAALILTACNPPAAPIQTGAATDEPWAIEWNALVDAARAEGKVIVKGNPDEALRIEFPKAFSDKFGIEVEYLGTSSSEFVVKIDRERAAGIYSTDVVLGGTVLYASFYDNRWLDPIPPVLIHPDAVDGSKWPGGRLWYADPEEQYLLRLANTVSGNVFVNTNLARPSDLTSWNDLLKPEFTGRIGSDDIEQQSNGHNIATMLYLRLGEDFVRRLYLDQRVAMVRGQRQLADAAARGTYAVVLGMSEEEHQRLTSDGLPVAMARDLRELSGTTGGGPSLTGLIKDAPHPNAARLFINWLATRDGSEAFGKAANLVPVRTDVDRSAFPAYLVPEPGKDYIDTSDWDFATNIRLPAGARVRAFLAGRA
jgi:ABC-type Fe3+ transport system substrate-binding protein